MRALVLLVLAVVAAVAAAPKNLPSTWKKCDRKDPLFNACLREAIHVAIRELSDKGAKELGVFPIDPLRLTRVDIAQGTGPVSIDLHFTDLDIYGLKSTELDSVVGDLDKIHYHAFAHIPQGITLKGQYKIDGKVLVLPIKGEGPCELHLENATALVDILGVPVKKDGVTHGNITDFMFTFNTTRLRIRLDNLFNGNQDLSNNMNVFLNENWMDILNELKPAIQDAFGAAFKEITSRIYSRVPYDKLYA
ncbi:protein takeout-like [Thrips palmi]|uniref:Protein takeout-like n=1 Tax=Thrips palmi TaxID=161013 RepID=A0A6P8XZY4_THRPL|nr:protein takeout-like [Thrips palmi]